MRQRFALLIVTLLAGAGCSDSVPLTTSVAALPAASASASRSAARERLAQTLARSLANPATRAAVKRRLDASNAPEGKVQFQALMHADQSALLISVARAAASTPAELLSDMDAARNLELYLPVPSQRAAWTGDGNYLVGTIDRDGSQPVGFDSAGNRIALDPRTPPSVPVLALVPQETDFTRGHPDQILACVDMCGEGNGGGGGGPVTFNEGSGRAAGLYMIQSHISDSYESWLKGAPEYEYHVYGLGDNGQTVQLSCAGEQASGGANFDQNDADWTGSVLLMSDEALADYQSKHPGAPVRIMAWEDDDEACVDHADVNNISALVTSVDNAYKAFTSGKVDPTILRGIKAAPSIFALIQAIHNIILTNDDFIGNAVEGSISGDAPNGANWVIKSTGTVTTGWFTTAHLQ